MVFGAILVTGASLTASVFVFEVAILPLLFKYSKFVQRKMVFSNCINYPRNLNYEDPSSSNLIGARNCSIEFDSKTDKCPVKVGLWHIIPCTMFKEVLLEKDYDNLVSKYNDTLMNNNNVILIYCHGNSNHRASPYRLLLYQIFQQLDYHVIAFDYRGYGDSTNIKPTEQGVVEDCFHVYLWLMKTINLKEKPKIILWGHSLGSAIAANFVCNLSKLCSFYGVEELPAPDALVLESPFNNLMEEVEFHPCSKLVSWLPYYRDMFVKPFAVSSEYSFTTDQYLCNVPHVPCFMMHSIHDKIVPYHLADKLYNMVLESRGQNGSSLVFETFEDELIGHNNICEDKKFIPVVKNFIDSIKNQQ